MLSAIVLIVISSVIGSVIGADPPGGYYTTRYDHLDIENILNQKRLVVYYAACLLDKGPCPPQGTEFKSESVLSHDFFLFFLLSFIFICLDRDSWRKSNLCYGRRISLDILAN